MLQGFGFDGFGFGKGVTPNPLWSPFSLGPALVGYWDASAGTSFTLAGSNVAAWRDLVTGYSAAQATGGNQPAFSVTGLNGRPAVVFDGVDDYLEGGAIPAGFPGGANAGEVWALASNAALPADTTIRNIVGYGGVNAGEARNISREVVGGVNRARVAISGSGTNETTIDFSGAHVVRGIFTGAAMSVQIDGAAGTPLAGAQNTQTTRTRIGAAPSAAVGNYWNGQIAIILVTMSLSDSQAAQTLSWLKSRSGI